MHLNFFLPCRLRGASASRTFETQSLSSLSYSLSYSLRLAWRGRAPVALKSLWSLDVGGLWVWVILLCWVGQNKNLKIMLLCWELVLPKGPFCLKDPGSLIKLACAEFSTKPYSSPLLLYLCCHSYKWANPKKKNPSCSSAGSVLDFQTSF